MHVYNRACHRLKVEESSWFEISQPSPEEGTLVVFSCFVCTVCSEKGARAKEGPAEFCPGNENAPFHTWDEFSYVRKE